MRERCLAVLALAALSAAPACDRPNARSASTPALARTEPVPGAGSQDGRAPDDWFPDVVYDAIGADRAAHLRALQPYNLPAWVHARAHADGFTKPLTPERTLNPYYQSGDFDGDGRLDAAVLVRHRESGAIGILFVHSGATPTMLIGSGRDFGNGGDDFEWMTNWQVVPAHVRRTTGDALELSRFESASALVHRDAGAYRWRQLGD